MKNKKKRIIKNRGSNFEMRIKSYVLDNQRLLSKYNLVFHPIIAYPRKERVPLLSRIAIWILGIQGGMLDFKFNDLKQNRK